MAFVGFAVTNPISALAMIDQVRWRPVVYADTPRVLARYTKFLKVANQDTRKAVLFLLGATNLGKIAKEYERFSSVLVFDDLQNLHTLKSTISGFDIVDIANENGIDVQRHLTPAEMTEVVNRPDMPASPFPLVAKLTNALGKRRPSVLESTSRMPMPEAIPESGAQRMITEIKLILELTASPLPFAVVLDTYIRFLFHIVPRSKVTSMVTKKLPDDAKDLWGTALDLANSEVGLNMARAYRSLCESDDVDYRVGHAVSKFGLKPYSGDFLYFTSVLPPYRGCEFLKDLPQEEDLPKKSKRRFKAKPARAKAKKKASKKA